MSNHASRNSNFSPTRKKALQPNEEIRENGLAWRKLSDEDGVRRYDIRVGGQRQKGVIGREGRDGITLSQARNHLEDIRAEARLRPAEAADSDVAAPLFREVAAHYLEWSRAHHADHPHYASRMERYLLAWRQLLWPVALPHPNCYRTAVIAAEIMLPAYSPG